MLLMDESRRADLPKWLIGGFVIGVLISLLFEDTTSFAVLAVGGLGAFAGYALWRNDFRV